MRPKGSEILQPQLPGSLLRRPERTPASYSQAPPSASQRLLLSWWSWWSWGVRFSPVCEAAHCRGPENPTLGPEM